MSPFFNIIIPLYNKEAYISRAIDSILAQSYPHWHLIVVDDGSTDASAVRVQNYTDPRISLVRKQNSGAGATRNYGVAISASASYASPYLCFLDADDWWHPSFLSSLSALILSFPDADAYATSYFIVKNGRNRIAPIGFDQGFQQGPVNYCRIYARTLCMPIYASSVCVRRSSFGSGFSTSLSLGEDFVLWIRLAMHGTIVMLNEPLAYYCQDVPPSLRATGHLHSPQSHMLWNLYHLDAYESTNSDYKRLIDNLRVYALAPYFRSRSYHADALPLLDKVDWSAQPFSTRLYYRMPPFLLRFAYWLRRLASIVKNALISFRHR